MALQKEKKKHHKTTEIVLHKHFTESTNLIYQIVFMVGPENVMQSLYL